MRLHPIPCVYFYQCEATRRVKIGHTWGHPNERLELAARTCPAALIPLAVIRGNRELERDIHRRFGPQRHHAEWFEADDDLMAFIAEFGETWPDLGEVRWPRPKTFDAEKERVECKYTHEEHARACQASRERFDEGMRRRKQRREARIA